MNSTTARRKWLRWLETVQHPDTRLRVELAGLPGHMRLPGTWKSQGKFLHEHLVYLVNDGHMQVLLPGKKLALSRGDLLWLAPGTPFLCQGTNEKSLTILRCRLLIENPSGQAKSPWPWRLLSGGGACLPWLEWLVQEADQPDPWTPLRLRPLMGGFFTEMARIDTAEPAAHSGLSPLQRRALSRFISERPGARATPRELARVAGLSYDYFSRCFQRSYARTPRRWLLEQRIHLAMLRLTETDERIGEIATELGYSDLFLFSRQFKAVCGISPGAYRKSHS